MAWAPSATDDRAVAAIFAAKNRPSFNPLIIHLADRAAAEPWSRWTSARGSWRRISGPGL